MSARETRAGEDRSDHGAAHRVLSYLRLNMRFYLGIDAPCVRRTLTECRVRAGSGYAPDLIRDLVTLYRAEPEQVERINFRCAGIRRGDTGERFFLKEFPRLRAVHDLERQLRCSQADRAWRAGHLLPQYRILTPRPIGTAQVHGGDGVTEYLATEWLEGTTAWSDVLRRSPRVQRQEILSEFAGHMRRWHDRGLYLRDLVNNVLVTQERGQRWYWLTDLDGLHPIRCFNRGRVLYQMRQLGKWARPDPEEAELIARTYLAPSAGMNAADFAAAIRSALLEHRSGGRRP